MNAPLLSVIIAAHREGRIAHKTILSVLRAVKKLDDAKIHYEIIVTVDKGDKLTLDYFNRYKKHPFVAIHQLDFGDLALSRNHGISLAQGEYIAILDADDLISGNWFIEGLKYLRKSKELVVLHTHYSVNFGTQDIVWEKFDSRSTEEDALIMTWANRWDSAIITARKVLEQFPYQPNTEGYGSEDWHFNSQTLATDIPHRVVPQTALFVRRKDVSLMTQQAANRQTVRYTNLLDVNFMKQIDTSTYREKPTNENHPPHSLTSVKNVAKKAIRHVHQKAKRFKLYRTTTHDFVSRIRRQRELQVPNRFPKWLVDEWRQIHLIDKEIFPDSTLLKNVNIYHSEMYELGIIFSQLCHSISSLPDYVFFMPTLSKGGAELVALRYIHTIQELHPDWKIAVVTTENGEHPWKNRLPKSVDLLLFGDLTHHLPESLRLQLLARLIVQLKAQNLHIAQSPLMFKFAALYQALLEPYKLYCFGFCEDTDNQGRIAGHIHSGLPGAYDTVYKVITDNKTIITQLVGEYAFSESRFSAHYQPVELPLEPPRQRASSHKTLRVLWASRIAKQKRPDVLIEIAKRLPVTIHIDMYGSFQEGYSGLDFDDIPSLTYKGSFDNINSIPTRDYDAFLYTSENDGIPNILLEVTAKGLPIIAPNVGGIAEFIDSSTGILIEEADNYESYLNGLLDLMNSDDYRLSLVEAAQSKLMKQHSTEQFLESVGRDIT